MAEQQRAEEANEAARLREAAGRLAVALDAGGFFRAAAYAAMAADAVEEACGAVRSVPSVPSL